MCIDIDWNPTMVCAMVLLITSVCIIGGCIEIGDTTNTPADPVPSGSINTPPVPLPDERAQSTPIPAASPSPANAEMVPGSAEYTAAMPPGSALQTDYRSLSYAPDNTTTPLDYPTAPFFQGAYRLGYSNTGILANLSNPPFVIEFKTDARSKNPNDARVIITVRDALTGRILEEEGYNGEYSSDPVKRIVIRDKGSYHVNIYGYGATVQVTLRGGVSPDKAVPYGVFAPLPTPLTVDYSEENYDEMPH